MSLPKSAPLITFGPNVLGQDVCKINYEIPIHQAKIFGHYRADAARVLRVIRGTAQEGDLKAIQNLNLNPVGVDTLFAALAYELLTT